jgi:hypothetical protein
MNIKTIISYNHNEFDKQVNELLALGWELHGDPVFSNVPQQEQTGVGRLRAWVERSYQQTLKKQTAATGNLKEQPPITTDTITKT